jgi:hypothetical protein
MSAKRLLIAVWVAVTMLVVSAAAQEKNELAGGLGRTFIADQRIKPGSIPLLNNVVHFGNGTTFEINYARHLMGKGFFRLDGEVVVAGNPDEDLGSGNGAVPEGYSSYFVTPAARVKVFADTAIEPWISFGGGYGHFSFSKTLVYGGINPGATSKNSGLIQGGLGLDVKPWRRFAMRLAARDFWSDALPLNVDTGKTHQHNIVVTGGLVWRF